MNRGGGFQRGGRGGSRPQRGLCLMLCLECVFLIEGGGGRGGGGFGASNQGPPDQIIGMEIFIPIGFIHS